MSTRTEYVEAIKTSLVSLLKKSLFDALVLRLPFLAWGPIGPFVSLCLQKLCEIIVNETEVAIFCAYVDFRVNRQSDTFTAKALENFKMQKEGTDEQKRIAEKELIDSFRTFIKLTS